MFWQPKSSQKHRICGHSYKHLHTNIQYVDYLLQFQKTPNCKNNRKPILFYIFQQIEAPKSAYHHHLMLCGGACTSPAFCGLIACSWLNLAIHDTQRPFVSKKHSESTRSKSQISPEWAERHKFSPTDCCPRHVLPIERADNEHSHHRLLCQVQGHASVEWYQEWRHRSLTGVGPSAVSGTKDGVSYCCDIS